jgi:hypothetical protein
MAGSKLELITNQAQLRSGDLLEVRSCIRCTGKTHRFFLLHLKERLGHVDVWATTGAHPEQCWPCAIREGRLWRIVPPELEEQRVVLRRLAEPAGIR